MHVPVADLVFMSDEGLENAIYDNYVMRSFQHIDFMSEQVPDVTILMKFRHLQERNGIGERNLTDINYRLDAVGIIMHGGTIVNDTLVVVPSSNKNAENKRDLEMHQSRKGK